MVFPFAAADCEVNLAVVCYLPFSLARSLAPKDSPAKSSGIQSSTCLHLPTPSCLISVTHTPAARNPSLPAHRRASCVCESLTLWNGSAGLRKRGRRAGFTPRVSKRGKLHRTGEEKNTRQAPWALLQLRRGNIETHVVLVTRRHVSTTLPQTDAKGREDGISSSQVSSDDRKSAGKG